MKKNILNVDLKIVKPYTSNGVWCVMLRLKCHLILAMTILTVCLHVLFYQEGADALIGAARAGDIEAVKRQLRGHTDINSRDEVYNYLTYVML